MSEFIFNILIFYSIYDNQLIQCLISLEGGFLISQLGYHQNGSWCHLLKILFRLICQKLELMYQKSCLRQNVERKETIFDKKLMLHNNLHEETQTYMFIILLNDWCSNILCYYLSIKLELICLFIFEASNLRRFFDFFCGLTSHSHVSSSLVNYLWLCSNSVFFLLIKIIKELILKMLNDKENKK